MVKEGTSKAVYFENLDALRFLAFFSVFLYHAFYTKAPEILGLPFVVMLKEHVFVNGDLGVNFFFVLSGFLISYLLIKERQGTGRVDVGKFYLRRILRIWPLYYLCLLVGFVLFPYMRTIFGESSEGTSRPLYYVLFLSNFDMLNGNDPNNSILSVLWSIAVEEQFYLVWPLFFVFVPHRYFGAVFFGILAVSIVFRVINNDPYAHSIHTLSCIGDMAVGGLGALITSKEGKWRRAISTLKKHHLVLIYLSAVGVFFFRHELYTFDLLRPILRAAIACIFLLVILEQNYCNNSLFKFGRIKVFTRLGRISFGLYCLHFVGIHVSLELSKILGTDHATWVFILLEAAFAFGSTIAMSWLSFKYVERPFLKLKSRFSVLSVRQ